jgi:DNA invertase Pin-like site-specific DNA recombinase
MEQKTKLVEHIAIYHRPAVAGGPGVTLTVERCQDYCLSNWGGHGVVFDDSGLSGLSFRRPALHSLMALAEAGSIKVIVVYDFNALGRDALHLVSMVEDLLCRGIEVHTVASGGLVNSAVQSVLLADEDRQARVARMKAGRERAKRARQEAR